MASSSSSSVRPPQSWTYDVFLSFRGEDTRNNFVDHLYAALLQRGIFTFKDDEMLRRGKVIRPELLKAIEESRIAVVVFSEKYVDSGWCLDELVKIMECHERLGQRVLPVFYHVNPSDVRGQKGNMQLYTSRVPCIPFSVSMDCLLSKKDPKMDQVKRWKEALGAAGNLSGWHIMKIDKRGESEFINKIIHEILGDIKPLGMDNNPIGIESHIDALNSLLETKASKATKTTEEVRTIGIWGMSGIGKTTIAQALFQRIANKFEGSSFVKDVRRNSSNKGGICALQVKMIKDILMHDRYPNIEDPVYGASLIQTRFSNKKVLLVLDDVDNINQLEFLAATHEWFGRGSRIIITTRNEHLLSDAHAKYKPDLLHIDQAVELFSRHAFHKKSPPKGYEDLSNRAIHYAGYLPLALKVLGSFFHGRQAGVWESALNRLAKAPNIEIFETLKLSFDGLDAFEKKIFLDIACFFKGKDKERVTRILDSFGFEPVIGISVLVEKSLITISNKKLDMHDLVQEMGWQIVRESFSTSMLWELEQIHDLIDTSKKLEAIEAIVLRDKEYNLDDHDLKPCFSANVFEGMESLRLLDVHSNFTNSQPHFLPAQLRWLCWHKYPFFALEMPHMRKLVGLEMLNSNMKCLWDGQKILPNLKFVDLSESVSLKMFPDISGAPNIERLKLSNCTSLLEVHESLGFHRKLVYLDMSGCYQLKCLPSKLKMESLETLILSDCQSLERFPEVSSCMVKLSKIDLDNCLLIKELPSSICELKHLKSLHLNNCKELKLPKELGNMKNLEELWLGIPEQLKLGNMALWQGFGVPPLPIGFHTLTNLSSLRKLDLSRRKIKEEDFPINLDGFSSLEELHLSGNLELTQLPTCISRLSHLKLLELSWCRRLQRLHLLPSGLQVLRARSCNSLEKIGDLSKEYEWLYKIWLLDCHKLLENQENERYLDQMLQESFLKKCAAVNHRLSITLPRRKIPSWFEQKQNGCHIALKLPPKWHTQIMGFAVCGLFYHKWEWPSIAPRIIFRIINDEKLVPNLGVSSVSVPSVTEKCNVWISYMPLDFFQQIYHDFEPQDWYHIQGNLVMTLMKPNGDKSVRCGAHIVYKEDAELNQQIKTCISDYGHMVHVDGDDCHEDRSYNKIVSANTYVYEEKLDDRSSNRMLIRNRMSRKRRLVNLHHMEAIYNMTY